MGNDAGDGNGGSDGSIDASSHGELTRRRALVTLGVGGLGSLAGCNGLGGGEEPAGDDDGGDGGNGNGNGNGSACGPPTNFRDSFPSLDGYEQTRTSVESGQGTEEDVEVAAYANYDGPDGGTVTFAVIEYTSASAAQEDIPEGDTGDPSASGYVLTDNVLYYGYAPTRSQVEALIRASPAVSDACADGNLQFVDDGDTQDGTDDTSDRSADEVRIGMIQPLSGALQVYGEMAMRGFYTYFGYRGANIPSDISEGEETFTVENTDYVVDVRDSGGDQIEAQNEASDMANDVDVLAGGTSTASALAIANNVANQRGIPYMAGPAANPDVTNDSNNCSAAVFRASETVAMDATTGGRYLANERDDIDSVYIYYADYSFGTAVRDNYRRVLEENGVVVAGEQPLPMQYDDDWPAQFDLAASEDVDAVVGGFTIATLPAMVGTYLASDYDFRLVSSLGTRLSAAALGATLTGILGENFTAADVRDSGLGPFTTRYHWNQYDNDIARAANRVHRDAYGTNTDYFTSGMFTAASAVVQAVEQARSADPSDIVENLTGMTVTETLKGRNAYEFQEYNNQARSAMTVAPVVPTADDQRAYWDGSIQPGEPVARYDMDETTQPASLVDCDLN